MSAAARTVVITGGARGIGAATARRLARDGYGICVNYVAHAAAADALAAELGAGGTRAVAVQADVTDAAAVVALFDAAERALGPITALVNNAGIAGARTPLGAHDAAVLRRVIEVNLIGACLCLDQAARRMAKSRGGPGGSIVNLSSSAARTGGVQLAPYVAAKAGIEGLTLAAARELAADGIRVNAVAPGVIATDQQPLGDAAWRARTVAATPLGRLGEADEVAAAVAWLLSDAASYVTGAVLSVAGGR